MPWSEAQRPLTRRRISGSPPEHALGPRSAAAALTNSGSGHPARLELASKHQALCLAKAAGVSCATTDHLLRRFRPARQSAEPSPITPRETEVLTLVARGYSNAEVAGLLHMSANTVTTHTKSIYRKLAVNSRSEAVFEAAQLGLIHLNGRRAAP